MAGSADGNHPTRLPLVHCVRPVSRGGLSIGLQRLMHFSYFLYWSA